MSSTMRFTKSNCIIGVILILASFSCKRSVPNGKYMDLLYIYKNSDTLKFHAANFLFANLNSHQTLIYKIRNKIKWIEDIDYKTIKDVNSLNDSIKSKNAWVEQIVNINDENQVSAEYLKNNIELAFNVYNNKWNNFLNFNEFCELVLPYRVATEPLENWRKLVLQKYRWLLNDKYTNMTSLAICDTIYKCTINDNFKFNQVFSSFGNTRNFSQMSRDSCGDCYDASSLVALICRGLGLPVTIDLVINWGNANGSHSWNTVLMPDGRYRLFMGQAIGSPLNYELNHRPSKVFRKRFAIQPSIAPLKLEDRSFLPRNLFRRDLIDVTQEYISTGDIILSPKNKIEENQAFISVYNNQKWVPLAYSSISNGKVCFSKMGKNNLYSILTFTKDSLVNYGEPFIFDTIGNIIQIIPNLVNRQTLDLKYAYRNDEYWPDCIKRFGIRAGRTYILYYYLNNKWLWLGEKTAMMDNKLSFELMPTNALFRIEEKGRIIDNRLFTYENNKQIWW